MEPATRREEYLAAACGEAAGELPEPLTRTEIFLAAIAGDYSGKLPEPVTREEIYLKKIAENGGGGITGPVRLLDGKEFNVRIKQLVNKDANYSTLDLTIKSIKMSKTAPPSGTTTVSLDEEEEGKCVAWLNDNIVYIFSNGCEMHMNSDSAYIFYNFESVLEIDVSDMRTYDVTNMGGMFWGCKSLASVDLSAFHTCKVTNMSYMFYQCYALSTVELSSFDTRNVVDMKSMFAYCKVLKQLDLSHFETSKVQSMALMFNNCYELSSLDLSGFSGESVTTVSGMFYGCIGLAVINLKNFRPMDGAIMKDTFKICRLLETIICNYTWNHGSSTDYQMFYDCKNLKGAISYDSTKITGDYANPDIGYFTRG